jgi:hypothetical protein
MNNILFEYLDTFCIIYLDNIIIYSETKEKHKLYIRKILQKLILTSLQIYIKKYKFKIQRTKFLGYIVSTNNVKINLEKVAIIETQEYPMII